ncbi:hypothetical protein [Streptomyces sp. NBC_01216]|uniref:hypothetical protein n=1 Tax=unclassified Streptomyces TaxID=2593676 RepID=UPI002E10981C|nr:cytochrome P450 [Streptomyces sp. NBC_01216]
MPTRLDTVVQQGHAELVRDVADTVPFLVLTDLLGVPDQRIRRTAQFVTRPGSPPATGTCASRTPGARNIPRPSSDPDHLAAIRRILDNPEGTTPARELTLFMPRDHKGRLSATIDH